MYCLKLTKRVFGRLAIPVQACWGSNEVAHFRSVARLPEATVRLAPRKRMVAPFFWGLAWPSRSPATSAMKDEPDRPPELDSVPYALDSACFFTVCARFGRRPSARRRRTARSSAAADATGKKVPPPSSLGDLPDISRSKPAPPELAGRRVVKDNPFLMRDRESKGDGTVAPRW